MRVSQEERDQHELTHTPYRAWCRHCVRGRGRNTPHRRRDPTEEEATTPRVSMDYLFVSSKDEAACANPVIVMIDESTGEKYARAVGQKGLGKDGEMDWLIKDMSLELQSWGHAGGESGHIILKSDGEPSILAVRDALAKYHGGRVVQEGPPPGGEPVQRRCGRGRQDGEGVCTSATRASRAQGQHQAGKCWKSRCLVDKMGSDDMLQIRRGRGWSHAV